MKPREDSTQASSENGDERYRELYALLSGGQAAYFLVTAVWALVSIRTFMRVTGPKTDIWLVKTASVLIASVGLVLGYAARRKEATPEVPLLAISSAAGLAAIDVVYVCKKTISPVYLLDALAELGLIGLWVALLRYKRSKQ